MMQKLLRKLLQVSLACALLWLTPRTIQSSQTKPFTPFICPQTNCIYIPVINMPPSLTIDNWFFIQYSVKVDTITLIDGEIENSSEFPVENVVIKHGLTQFTTRSKIILPKQQAPFRVEIHGSYPYIPSVRPVAFTWTVTSTANIQLLDILTTTAREQQDEFGGYTAVTVTLRNSSLNMLRDIDVQLWAHKFFDENYCRDCFKTYTQTSMLPQAVITITDRWRFIGNIPPTKTHPERIRVTGYGVISP